MAVALSLSVTLPRTASSSKRQTPGEQGPRCIHTVETLSTCIHGLQHLDISCPLNSLDDFEKEWQLREFFTPLIHAVKSETHHLEQVDFHFSKLLPAAYKNYPSHLQNPISDPLDEELCFKARNLLSRIPRVPQRLFSLPLNNSRLNAKRGTMLDSIKAGTWKNTYILPEARSLFRVGTPDNPMTTQDYIIDVRDLGWENMFVTSFIDTNSLVLLLKIASLGHVPDEAFAQSFLQYLNLIAELVDTYDTLMDLAHFDYQEALRDPAPSVQALKAALFPEASSEHELSLYVLKSFLWSAWQRSIMLYFSYIIGVQLWHGSSPKWSSMLAVRGVKRLIELDVCSYRGGDVPYLCNCAFELLRTSRSSLALDFRGLIDRFDSHFPNAKGRCVSDSDLSCNGSLLDSCQRFTKAETKAQSFHASGCNAKCPRIRWDEASYRRCDNPRAVIADLDSKSERLLYCKASSHTMAISHVWSHGQGGRPEDGVNLCLHKKYCSLAKALGCETYWIDSTCIPDDEQLRDEAIKSINSIFRESKVTLISDQDLQSVSIDNSSIKEFETLLSVLLVCDWGVRAWTMLEAVKGSTSIRILGKDDNTIALKDLLQRIHQFGAVDLAVLLGCVQHLLPSVDVGSDKETEEVGHLLSQRHASREGDEILIWGLLSTSKATKSVHDFWHMQRDVKTGFLVSSASRIEGIPGLGWAPATPYVRLQQRSVALGNGLRQKYSVYYPSYDGRGSQNAQRTPKGLFGRWLCLDMSLEVIEGLCECCREEKTTSLWLDQSRQSLIYSENSDTEVGPESELFPRPDFANACAALRMFAVTPGAKIKLLRPLAADGVNVYDGGNRRGEDFVLLVIVCVYMENNEARSLEHQCEWQWKGVYEWQDDSIEGWAVEELLIS